MVKGFLKNLNPVKKYFSFLIISSTFLFALLNPVYKKYDFGPGYRLVLVFCLLVLFLHFCEWKKKKHNSRMIFLEKFFILVFLVSSVISFFLSETKNVGFSEVLAFGGIFSFYLLFAYQKIPWVGKFFKIIKFATMAAILVGFVHYFTDSTPRMFGPFYNTEYHANKYPNAFAEYLLLVWPIFFLDLLKIFRKKDRQNNQNSKLKIMVSSVLPILSFSLTVSAILLSYSRAASLVFICQLFLIIIYFFYKFIFSKNSNQPESKVDNLSKNRFFNFFKSIAKVTLTSLIILVLSFIFFNGANSIRQNYQDQVITVEERVSFGNNEALTSKQERIDFWLGAIELIKTKPFFGHGPFSFRYAYNPIQQTLLGNSDHPHNVFLKIGAENGLVALFGFGSFFLVFFYRIFRNFKLLDPQKKNVVYVLWVAIVGMLAHNLVDYNLNFLANLIPLFILMFFLSAISEEKSCGDDYIYDDVVKTENQTRASSFKDSVPYFSLILALIVSSFAVFEISLIFANKLWGPNSAPIIITDSSFSEEKSNKNNYLEKDFFDYSLYPRFHFLGKADYFFNNQAYEQALFYLEKQISLNILDSQAYYLRGRIYCNLDYQAYDLQKCHRDLKKAVTLNPKNDFNYHLEYLKVLENLRKENPQDQKLKEELQTAQSKAIYLIEKYFYFVDNNIHFTAYTSNVEAAAAVIDKLNLNSSNSELVEKKKEMLETAEILRSQRILKN